MAERMLYRHYDTESGITFIFSYLHGEKMLKDFEEISLSYRKILSQNEPLERIDTPEANTKKALLQQEAGLLYIEYLNLFLIGWESDFLRLPELPKEGGKQYFFTDNGFTKICQITIVRRTAL